MLDTYGEGLWEKVEEHSSAQRGYLMGHVAPVVFMMLTDWGNMYKDKNEAMKAYLPSLGFEGFDISMASQEEVHRVIVALTSDLLINGYTVREPDKYWKHEKENISRNRG